jgi:hypothetical protein
MEYLKDKINELAKNGNNRNIRDSIEERRNLGGFTNIEVT